MLLKGLIATLLALSLAASAQTTQYEQDVKRLFDVVYKPITFAVLACPDSRYPDPAKRAQCEEGAQKSGIRFYNKAVARAEAMECARLHAGLLARNSIYKIVDDAATDPWTAWRCLECKPSNNEEVNAKRSVRTYVVDNNGNVYDHRMRYFIPPFYAKQLGKINPRFAVTMWGNVRGQIPDIIAQQK
jgi:hypothetical protein